MSSSDVRTSCFGGVVARSLACFFDPSLEALLVEVPAASVFISVDLLLARAVGALVFAFNGRASAAESVPERKENIGEKIESMNRFRPLLTNPP